MYSGDYSGSSRIPIDSDSSQVLITVSSLCSKRKEVKELDKLKPEKLNKLLEEKVSDSILPFDSTSLSALNSISLHKNFENAKPLLSFTNFKNGISNVDEEDVSESSAILGAHSAIKGI